MEVKRFIAAGNVVLVETVLGMISSHYECTNVPWLILKEKHAVLGSPQNY